jgi:RNA polymerase sigma factor (sigma-70 family)
MSEDSDFQLLEAWRGGDKQAAKVLLNRYFAKLRAYFLQRVAFEHEDLVQETFARLVEAKEQYRGEAPFRVYLFSIARNVLNNHLRIRYKLDNKVEPLDSDTSIADITGKRHSSLLAEREEHRLLIDALRLLPVRYQELLELYYWQGMPGSEIAALFGVVESTVRSRLRTALDNLRRRYGELAAAPHKRDIEPEQVEVWLEELAGKLASLRIRSDD